MGEEKRFTTYIDSALGWIEIGSNETHIKTLYFHDEVGESDKSVPRVLQDARKQVSNYFNRKFKFFTLPLEPEGTDFRKTVWDELLNIQFGKTCSYLELSRRIGNEKAIRAVGTANGSNPISLIIPCHRVIGSDGSLTGYGGGLWRKKWLLEFEAESKQGDLFG